MCPPSNSTKSRQIGPSSSANDTMRESSTTNKEHQARLKPQKGLTFTSGGVAKYRRDIEIGILLLSVIYGIAYSWNIPVSSKYCDDDETTPCHRPDLVGFQAVCGLSMTYMGVLGAKNWYFDQTAPTHSPEDRLFGYWEGANNQNVAIFVYQVFDFAISLTIPEHQEAIFLIHHIFCALTAYLSLEYQCMTYYSVYYGGCAEISSIFLLWTNIDAMFPQYPQLKPIALVSKVLFVLTFLYYRVYGWTMVAIPVWKDTMYVLRNGSMEKYRPGKAIIFKFNLVMSIAFGLLQWYWLIEIVQKVQKLVGL